MKSKVPRNVKLLGFVEESEKRLQIERCTAAINPLFSGSAPISRCSIIFQLAPPW